MFSHLDFIYDRLQEPLLNSLCSIVIPYTYMDILLKREYIAYLRETVCRYKKCERTIFKISYLIQGYDCWMWSVFQWLKNMDIFCRKLQTIDQKVLYWAVINFWTWNRFFNRKCMTSCKMILTKTAAVCWVLSFVEISCRKIRSHGGLWKRQNLKKKLFFASYHVVKNVRPDDTWLEDITCPHFYTVYN